MYELTCPSCSCLTQSPFVRTGAVVRCESCEHKYRIRSSQVEHVLKTGPRTFNETDAVLRTDSVDIDPDEIVPVSIDDDGNVIGLSGLSELMRQSDAQGTKEKLRARAKQADADKDPDALAPGRLKTKSKTDNRRKPDRRKRPARKRSGMPILPMFLGGIVLLLIGGILALFLSGVGIPKVPPSHPATRNPPAPSPPTHTPKPDSAETGSGSETGTTGTDTPTTDPATDPVPPPIANPDPKFQPPWQALADAPPADVPTVLTPSVRLDQEGWYVMSPPRGAAAASGETGVQLGELKPTRLDGERTLLTGTVSNRSDRAVLAGELHLMLLDSTGRVFAETYRSLTMLALDDSVQVQLPIKTLDWQRSRGVRSGVSVADWADGLSPMSDVKTEVVGVAGQTAVRVSAKHTGEKRLRSVLIVIDALDDRGAVLARFKVDEKNLYVAPGQWLDLVVAAPLDEGQRAARWSAVVQPR